MPCCCVLRTINFPVAEKGLGGTERSTMVFLVWPQSLDASLIDIACMKNYIRVELLHNLVEASIDLFRYP